MHILLIPSWYKSEAVPTSGSFFREQAIALREKGHQVGLIYVGFLGKKNWFSSEAFKLKHYIDEGVVVYSLILPSFGLTKYDWCHRGLREKLLMALYKKYNKEQGKPDVIHGHATLMAGYCSANLGEREQIPVVITEHSTAFSNGQIKDRAKYYVEACFQKADRLIAVSESLKQFMMPYNQQAKPIQVIGNMVDLKQFKIVQKKAKEKFTFLAVAYLAQKKGIDVLLKAFAQAFKGKEKVELVIGGDGEEREALERLTKNLGIEKQVIFKGSLSRREVAEVMSQCDVFTLPSRHETFGVVFIEALACGKPIIAASCGGPNDIVTPQNGKLVAVDSVEELGQAMVTLYEQYETYEGEAIRADCYTRFSKEMVVKQLEAVYRDCLKAK